MTEHEREAGLVSTIIPVYNRPILIVEAVNSVLAQTYKNTEVIVVDDGSDDDTPSVLLSLQTEHPQVTVLTQQNQGPGVARELGRQHAKGEFIQFLDSDDLNKVARDWRSQKYTPGLCFKGWMPAHPTFYLKKRVYQAVGNYNIDLGYQADLEFCARAFELHKISSRFIESLWVRMRVGGVTNNRVQDILKGNWESYLALKSLGLKRGPINYFMLKWGAKLPQFLPPFLAQLFYKS